jgi:glycerophosphoryl diester phosphodiesterase
MKIKKILFLLMAITACSQEEYVIQNLNGNVITALGHGGMGIGSTYPMDSYESIMSCLSLGMAGSELDVQMSMDSVLVAYHDEFLEERTQLHGRIHALLWEDISQARYNELPYAGYSIISLEELFSGIPKVNQYTFTFDCKFYREEGDLNSYLSTFAGSLIRIIDTYGLEGKVCIESQDLQFLEVLHHLKPNYKLFIYPSSFDNGLQSAQELGISGITISHNLISKEQISLAHQNNLLIAIWNIQSDAENREAISKNPDYIQTDKVKSLVKLLK